MHIHVYEFLVEGEGVWLTGTDEDHAHLHERKRQLLGHLEFSRFYNGTSIVLQKLRIIEYKMQTKSKIIDV